MSKLYHSLKSLIGMDEDEVTHKNVLLALGFSFSHRSFLEEFDLQNGLNEVFPSMSFLSILPYPRYHSALCGRRCHLNSPESAPQCIVRAERVFLHLDSVKSDRL